MMFLKKLENFWKKYYSFFKKEFPKLNKFIISQSPFFKKYDVKCLQKKDNKTIFQNLKYFKKLKFLFNLSYNRLLVGYVNNQDLIFLTGLVACLDRVIRLLIITNLVLFQKIFLYKFVIFFFILRMIVAIFENILWNKRANCWFVNPWETVIQGTKLLKNGMFGKSATLNFVGTTFATSCIWEHGTGYNTFKAIKCGFSEEHSWNELWLDAKKSFYNKDYQNKSYWKWGGEPLPKKKIILINLQK